MFLPLLALQQKKITFKEFVAFWFSLNIPSNKDHYYTDRIDKDQFTTGDIGKLFAWKNGMEINGHYTKRASVINMQKKILHINHLKEGFELEYFTTHFGEIGAIWQIFLLHIIAPHIYPIFDQHVYRACQFLKSRQISEIPKKKVAILEYYHNEYHPFFKDACKQFKQPRKVDLALKSFGTFLKTHYAKKAL
ncbi:hypothetical protein SAMN05428988_5307 [Chitinophaga sp. YR573]|uniref:hypothetical protein n=1 Tax=Chitinophaga sp. YR573 TaxID=1881040 RepID=UPI0008BF9865|nr:hypothetical protein [Chitinophaga sp. YR573]SEW40466.1 hypothetical protein SAMN05428988_5307 [Chitinophaga sp. YR573]